MLEDYVLDYIKASAANDTKKMARIEKDIMKLGMTVTDLKLICKYYKLSTKEKENA